MQKHKYSFLRYYRYIFKNSNFCHLQYEYFFRGCCLWYKNLLTFAYPKLFASYESRRLKYCKTVLNLQTEYCKLESWKLSKLCAYVGAKRLTANFWSPGQIIKILLSGHITFDTKINEILGSLVFYWPDFFDKLLDQEFMAINLQLVTPNFAHPNLFHHTEQIIEDIHAKCNVFYILGYKTLTAYVQIFLSVLGPFSNSQFDTFHLHLSYFRAIFLSNSSVHYYKHLSTCHRQTNVLVKCE